MRSCLILTLTILCASVTSSVWAQDRARSFLTVELPFLQLAEGEQLQLFARYQSCVGRQVVLANSDAEFQLGDDSMTHTLRDPDLGDAFLLWQVVVQKRVGGRHRYTLTAVAKAESLATWYRNHGKALPQLDFGRYVTVLEWLMQKAAEDLDTKTLELSLEQFQEYMKKQAQVDSSRDLRWLAAGDRHLKGDPSWMTFVESFIDKTQIPVTAEKSLEKLGFVKLAVGWVREDKVLDAIGMVRDEDGKVRSVARSLLREAAISWGGNTRDVELLRGYTRQQYEEIALRHRIKKGMQRRDLAVAWGYPTEVTWQRRGDLYYEAWLFEDRQAFLVEGLLFDWNLATQ